MAPNPGAFWVCGAPKSVLDAAKLKLLLLWEPEPNPAAPKPDVDDGVAPNPDVVKPNPEPDEPNPCDGAWELELFSSEITLI